METPGIETADDDVGGVRVPKPHGHGAKGLGPVGARRFYGYGVVAVVLRSRRWVVKSNYSNVHAAVGFYI